MSRRPESDRPESQHEPYRPAPAPIAYPLVAIGLVGLLVVLLVAATTLDWTFVTPVVTVLLVAGLATVAATLAMHRHARVRRRLQRRQSSSD